MPIQVTLSDLTDTAQNVLRYMVQEPRSFVRVIKETTCRNRYTPAKTSVSQASLVSRDHKDVNFGYGWAKSINKASLAAMPNKNLLTEIPKPENYKSRYGDQYDEKFYVLTPLGANLGNALLAEEYKPISIRRAAQDKQDQAMFSVTSAQNAVDKAEAALSLAKNEAEAAKNLLAELGDETFLTPDQAVLLEKVKAHGNVIIAGRTNNAVLRRLSEENPDSWFIGKDSPTHYAVSPTFRPTLIIIEDIDLLLDHDIRAKFFALRDGGRVVCSASGTREIEGVPFYGLDEPLIIKED